MRLISGDKKPIGVMGVGGKAQDLEEQVQHSIKKQIQTNKNQRDIEILYPEERLSHKIV